MNTEFVNVDAKSIIDESQKLKFAGYHLMQQCATRIPDAYELIYSFGKGRAPLPVRSWKRYRRR